MSMRLVLRITTYTALFLSLSGFSGFFVTRVSGSAPTSVKFTFYDGSDSSKPARLHITSFGVEKFVSKGKWVPVWVVSDLPTIAMVSYGNDSIGKEIVQAQPLLPGEKYRSYAAAISLFGPIRYSGLLFTIAPSGEVISAY